MKSKTFVKPNYLLSVIAFILLLFFSIVSQKFEYSEIADYLSCDVISTTAEDIDLSYDIRKYREDGDLVNHIELHIPSETQLHVCGVFSDGTVDIDDISMDIDLDQESIQLLDDHPVRSHGDSLAENNTVFESELFWRKIHVNQIGSDELAQLHSKVAFKSEHIGEYRVISTIVAALVFLGGSILIIRKENIPSVAKLAVPWLMCLIVVVLYNVVFKVIFL